MKARISHIKDTKIIELLNKSIGPWGYIVRNHIPFWMEVKSGGWLNPENYGHEEMILNWRGSFDTNIRPMDFVPIVKLSTLLDSPEIETSFYGLVNFHELASPSDYIRAHNGEIEIYGPHMKIETTEGNLKVVGEGIVRREGYYQSFPVEIVQKTDISSQLEELIMDPDKGQESYQSIEDLRKLRLIKSSKLFLYQLP